MNPVIEQLRMLSLAQMIPVQPARVAAYQAALASSSLDDLRWLCMVLAEGNQYGPDAARVLAGVG